ncbi:MAG: hypothetical protein AB7Q27_21740, partial [Acidimicrobiia bacterium]
GTATKEMLTGTYSQLDLVYAGATSSRTNVSITGATTITFATVPVTVQLLSSTGTGIAGATVNYFNPYWNTLGTTNASGTATKEMLPATYSTLQLDYAGGTNTRTNVAITGATTITFTTVPVTITVLNGSGTSVSGATVSYANPYWNSFGTTGAGGVVAKEMLPDNYDSITASWTGGTAQRTNVAVTAATSLTLSP